MLPCPWPETGDAKSETDAPSRPVEINFQRLGEEPTADTAQNSTAAG